MIPSLQTASAIEAFQGGAIMSMQEFAGIVAAVVGVCAFVPYILAIFGRDILLRRIGHPTRPERVTWFIWLILGGELLVMNYLIGARDTLPLIAAYTGAYFIITILSIKRGTGGWTPLNKACLYGGVVAATAWAILKLYGMQYGASVADWPEITAIIVSGVADIAAFTPTILHAWNKPLEENRTGWTLGFCGAVINLFAIQYAFNVTGFAIAFFPLYNALLMGVVATILWLHPRGARYRRLKSA